MTAILRGSAEFVKDILSELEGKPLVVRRIANMPLERLRKRGTDREDRDISYWLKRANTPGYCSECSQRFRFNEVTEADDGRLLIRCPYDMPIDNSLVEHSDCPVYMGVAGSSQVFWGVEKTVEGVAETIRSFRMDEILLVYNPDMLEHFDSERFRFKGEPKKALLYIIRS